MSVDCALITALPAEMGKLLFHFRHWNEVASGKNIYFETFSPSGLTLVGAVCTGMGQLHAAAITTDLVAKYQPKTIVLVGIAAGLERKIGLGDVVISSSLVDYELGKVGPEGLDIRWSVYPIDQLLLNKAQNYQGTSWKDYIRTPRPGGGDATARPQSHIGIYLTGNKVIADEKTAGALRSFWKKSVAIEMEAAGIAAMLRQLEQPPGFIVILLCICDYADAQKNDDWQAYAADAAASFAFSFVMDALTPQDMVLPHRAKTSNSEGLWVTLAGIYDLSELKVLCYDLDIDWDEIAGQRKSEKIVELITYCKRHGQFPDLVAKINRDNDNVLNAYREQ